jgi:hypothetical protein
LNSLERRRRVCIVKCVQPAADRPRGRHHAEAAEALHQRVVLEERDMAQPTPADHHQGDDQAHHRDDAEVAPARCARKCLRITAALNRGRRRKIAPEQLEPGIRRQRDVG